jgi:hypothetical protein
MTNISEEHTASIFTKITMRIEATVEKNTFYITNSLTLTAEGFMKYATVLMKV